MRKYKYFLIVGIFLFALGPRVWAQEQGESFVPPEGKLADTHTMKMGGLTISSFLYKTALSVADVTTYYQNFMALRGFRVGMETA